MRVWRLAREPYCQDRIGEGAKMFGGRWNAVGTGILYCSSTRSLAALEYLAHLGNVHPNDVVLVGVELPGDCKIDHPDIKTLPEDWASPFPSPNCQAWGTAWCHNSGALAIALPSAIVPEEENIIVNTAHPDMAKVTLKPIRRFNFDLRLLHQ
ncbi:MAG: RES family NAD+ phosphorylase [Betaproteobacteria bacterium]